MNKKSKLELEILSGPLDGQVVTITADSDWTRLPGSLLSFPWDDELGAPQARFVLEDEWMLAVVIKSSHGTYLVNKSERLNDNEKIFLEDGSVLKASTTWLIAKNMA